MRSCYAMYENAKQAQFYFLKSSDFERRVITEVKMASASVTNAAQLAVNR